MSLNFNMLRITPKDGRGAGCENPAPGVGKVSISPPHSAAKNEIFLYSEIVTKTGLIVAWNPAEGVYYWCARDSGA